MRNSTVQSIQGVSLLTLLLSFLLLSVACTSPLWSQSLSSPMIVHISRTHPLLVTFASNLLDGTAVASVALFVLATVWECLPMGAGPPLKTFLPCYLLLLRPLLDILQLARSVQYNLFLALVLLFTLLWIRASIRITAKVVNVVYRVTAGTLRLGGTVSRAVGKALTTV